MNRFCAALLLPLLLNAAPSWGAEGEDDVSSFWNKTYRDGMLMLDNPRIPAQLAVSRFVYHDFKVEVENMARKFSCASLEFTEGGFAAEDCSYSQELPQIRQSVYGRVTSLKEGDDQVYTQIYALSPVPGSPELRTRARELLDQDPLAHPLDEWILSVTSGEESQEVVFYENQKLGGTISVSLGQYTDQDRHKFLDTLGKILMCRKAERVDNGANFSDCQSYRYYEIRDLKFPYYVLSSISSDLVTNPGAMEWFARIAKEAWDYNTELLEKKSPANGGE